MIDKTWEGLVGSLSTKMMVHLKDGLDQKAWDLIPDDGKQDLIDCSALLVECALVEAAGGDAAVAKMALSAAIGNWETAGRIRAVGHADEFLSLLKEGFIEAASIGLQLLGAGLRSVVLGK